MRHSRRNRTERSGLPIRIRDLVVQAGQQPDVLIEPPLLVVEILSPDDTCSDTQERAKDYFQMGVSTVRIIDPKTRTGIVCKVYYTNFRHITLSVRLL